MSITHRLVGKYGMLFLMLGVVPGILQARMLTVDPVFEPYTERTEFAVKRALNFLLRNQREDGTFPGAQGETTGVVALGGMAFLAAGFTPGDQTAEGVAINRCIDYCLKRQASTGYLGADTGNMYSHCAATLFLSEVSGMVEPARQERIKPALAKATAVILKAQLVKKKKAIDQGGWRYSPAATDSDMSLTGWAIMSLRAARLNGAPVPDSAIKNAMMYVRNDEVEGKGAFRYEGGRPGSASMTSVALLCMELCGLHGQDITIRAGDWLDKNVKSFELSHMKEYAVYYGAQAMFQLGGGYWKAMADWMYPFWLKNQGADGSWSGGTDVCTSYVTSMVILSLTVPYRQLPIYQRDETVDEY